MMDEVNKTLLERSLAYHGLPLQKAWEEEKGINDLKRLGLVNLDYSVYFARQRSLNFNDRAKRLRLHQFMCKKANYLFDTKNLETISKRIYKERHVPGTYAVIPPFDYFSNLSAETRTDHFYNSVQPGDIFYGTVASKTSYGLLFKVLCSVGSTSRFVADLNIKAFIYTENLVNAVDKKNVTRSFASNDLIRCEVLEVLPDVKKIGCGMKSDVHDRFDSKDKLGLIVIEEFPPFYKLCLESRDTNFNSVLEDAVSFQNPASVDNLLLECGLNTKKIYTNMSSLKGKFPQEEYATDLRHQQTSKLAVRSVAEGIEHFKNGRHTEAFQCLNRALSIDPNNVEGLVARGALCANSGYFKKAVVDFEAALKLNPSHVNARKYLCETLVALGRNYEDESKTEEARKAYQDCLKINPNHEEALSSLDYLKSKSSFKIVEPAELEMPLNIGGISSHKDKDHDFGKKDDSGKKDKKKKDKKKRNKKRHSSSSESSSESSDSKSSDSSSESSSSESSSESSDSERPKKKDRKDKSHQKSLSPLSKRMAIMSENIQSRDGGSYQYNQGYENVPSGSGGNLDDYEMKVRKFLDMPREDDDYEEKVRKFVAEASKLQKAKQQEEKASKKKKKKDERKMKKDSKKKNKKDKKKSKSKKEKDYDNMPEKKLRDALKLLETLNPDALNDLYAKGVPEKEKEELPVKQKQPEPDQKFGYDKEEDFSSGKWKMMFSKDERSNEQMNKSKQPKQYAFGYDSEEEDEQQRNVQSQPSTSAAPSSSQAGNFSGSYDKMSKKRHLTPPKPKEIPPVASQVKSGPVVLDKFGNFRLAQPSDPIKPLESAHSRRSRSRSRKKYDSSSSRSKSRSPRRRSGSYPRRNKYSRSRSHSYGRRSGTRSRSRSRSYSRSRSRSGDRRRFSKNYRGRGGNSSYDRGTYYKPRFSSNLRGRGRGSNGNFRDSRDFRGGRGGRFDRSAYRPRQAPIRGNGRQFDYRRDDYRDRRRDTRSRSFSPLERDRPPRSPLNDERFGSDHERDNKKMPISPPIEGRWADEKRHDRDDLGPGIEEYDKMLDKARKEKKEEMIDRNKDIVKKTVC